MSQLILNMETPTTANATAVAAVNPVTIPAVTCHHNLLCDCRQFLLLPTPLSPLLHKPLPPEAVAMK